MRGRTGAIVVAVVAALVAGCGDETQVATGPAADSGCLPASQQPEVSDKESFKAPKSVLQPGAARVVMTTSCGVITIRLDRKVGGPIPNSVAFLADQGFYDTLTFHRVVDDFVLQGGDPEGDGTGDAGYNVVGPVPSGYRYKVGDVAMAKSAQDAPGTASSQFFVVSSQAGADGLSSQPDYGLVGHADDKESLETIARIDALAIPGEQFSPPSQPVWIVSAKLEQ